MEKADKIGFFETWNAEAQRVEFSITRVQMLLSTLFDFYFIWQFFIVKNKPATWDNLLLTLILILLAIAPKAVKDLAINLVNKRN